jgi:hypothetical protein
MHPTAFLQQVSVKHLLLHWLVQVPGVPSIHSQVVSVMQVAASVASHLLVHCAEAVSHVH